MFYRHKSACIKAVFFESPNNNYIKQTIGLSLFKAGSLFQSFIIIFNLHLLIALLSQRHWQFIQKKITNITGCKKQQAIQTAACFRAKGCDVRTSLETHCRSVKLIYHSHDRQDLPGRQLQQQYNASDSWSSYIWK